MCGGQRENNIVLRRRRLQLEIEFAAKALAQRQSPGAVDAAAVGRMDDELHAADLVEEALEHDCVLRRQAAQRRMGRGQIFEQLLGRALGDPDFIHKPAQYSLGWFAAAHARGDFRPQARYGRRQFIAAAGRFSEPEWNRRRHAMGIFDAHHAAFDADDAIALVTELKDVAGQALDREIFVHRPDEMVLRLEQDLIVGVVGDRPSRSQRSEARTAPPAQHVVDAVVVDQRAAAAAPGAKTFRQHSHHCRKIVPRQRAIGRGAAHERVEFVLVPFACP